MHFITELREEGSAADSSAKLLVAHWGHVFGASPLRTLAAMHRLLACGRPLSDDVLEPLTLERFSVFDTRRLGADGALVLHEAYPAMISGAEMPDRRLRLALLASPTRPLRPVSGRSRSRNRATNCLQRR